ncbi:MAG TPA: FUSC family protein [Acidimicrobiales bacterium]|nr:FUSC family protein [Acidimicrobiales bacterium]
MSDDTVAGEPVSGTSQPSPSAALAPSPPATEGRHQVRSNWLHRALVAERPVWSSAAALRALRATIVIPALFALTDKVVGNPQMALFATFGGVAMLILASFGGSRRNLLVAYLTSGAVGSVLLTLGTAVNATTAVAAVVTVPVVFIVLFAGVVGPNAASGATAVLLSYVLPAASPGTIAMVPSRLAGWWLAVAAGAVAVLLLSPRPPSSRLAAAAARSAASLAAQLDAVLAGADPSGAADAAHRALVDLDAAFTAVPYRPTGVAVADQSLASLVESLAWGTDLVADLSGEAGLIATAAPIDRQLLEDSSRALAAAAAVLGGSRATPPLVALEGATDQSWGELARGRPDQVERAVHAAFHAQMVAAAARRVVIDAAGASRLVSKGASETAAAGGIRALVRPVISPLSSAGRLVLGHASVRSVWTRNSARGAVALAGAVAVADLVNVQHGFWVVLAALSILRTSAGATGATALRGLAGTAVGFFVGAAIVDAIGVGSSALWAALPLAVMVAAYTPGTVPFAAGQAAFTLELSILYNLLVPIGWKVGVLRLEDVALGAAVSVVVGLLFWPRGAVTVVADDLADAYHTGGVYLAQSTSWMLGVRTAPPDPAPSRRAEERLEDAMRVMLAEQGTKKVPKEQLWLLVAGTLRLRLSAQSLARFAGGAQVPDATRRELVGESVELAASCDDLAAILGRPQPAAARARDLAPPAGPRTRPGALPPATGIPEGVSSPVAVLVRHLLGHVRKGVEEVTGPARAVGARRTSPWWR